RWQIYRVESGLVVYRQQRESHALRADGDVEADFVRGVDAERADLADHAAIGRRGAVYAADGDQLVGVRVDGVERRHLRSGEVAVVGHAGDPRAIAEREVGGRHRRARVRMGAEVVA